MKRWNIRAIWINNSFNLVASCRCTEGEYCLTFVRNYKLGSGKLIISFDGWMVGWMNDGWRRVKRRLVAIKVFSRPNTKNYWIKADRLIPHNKSLKHRKLICKCFTSIHTNHFGAYFLFKKKLLIPFKLDKIIQAVVKAFFYYSLFCIK